MSKEVGVSTNHLVSETKAKQWPQYVAALSVCMGAAAAGTVLGFTGNVTRYSLQHGDLNGFDISESEYGWLGSFMALGAMVMCFPIGILCDIFGRKPTMLLTIVPFSVGWLLIIFSTNIGMVYAGRFLTGMAGGAFCVSAPLYTSEIAQKEIRGSLGSYFQLLLTVGILLAYVLGAFLSPKVVAIVCAIVPLIFGVVFFLQPETPFYLLKKNKEKEALAALRRFRGADYNSEAEIKEMKAIIDADQAQSASLQEVFQRRSTKKSLIICFGLMTFQQLGGINAVVFYVGEIFESANSSLSSSNATILVGSMQVIATFVSSLIIDRFGRKILLLISAFFMGIAGLMLGIYFTLKDRDVISADKVEDIGILPVISLCLFIIVFSLGFGPIPWMIAAEVLPAEIKSVAGSAASTYNWFLAFLVTKFYADLNNAIGGDSTFYIFSLIVFLGTVFVFFYLPETKGKTLEEIQRVLNGEKPQSRGVDNQAFSQ